MKHSKSRRTTGLLAIIPLTVLSLRCGRRAEPPLSPTSEGQAHSSRSPESAVNRDIEWTGVSVPDRVRLAQLFPIRVTVRNSGKTPLSPENLSLSYHWLGPSPERQLLIWDGLRTPIKQSIEAGASVAIPAMAIRAPEVAGSYTLRIDLVRDGVGWFSSKGAPTSDHNVVVTP